MDTVAEVVGFEPTDEGVKVLCLTAWLHLCITQIIISHFFVFVNLFFLIIFL